MRKITNILILAGAASGLFGITAYLFSDLWISRFIQDLFDNREFYYLMTAVSWPGYAGRQWLVALLAILVLLRFRLRIEAVYLLLGSATSWILINSIKVIVGRPRPTPDMVRVFEHPASQSFPSGHVASYMALYGFLFYIVYERMRHSPIRGALLIALGSIIILVGVSRVYLGAHWASDVFGGYCFGFFWLALTIYACEINRARLRP